MRAAGELHLQNFQLLWERFRKDLEGSAPHTGNSMQDGSFLLDGSGRIIVDAATVDAHKGRWGAVRALTRYATPTE